MTKVLKTAATDQEAWDALQALTNVPMKPPNSQEYYFAREGDNTLRFYHESGHSTRNCSRANVDKLMAYIREGRQNEIRESINVSTYLKDALLRAGVLFYDEGLSAFKDASAENFIRFFEAIQTDVHDTAKSKGWWHKGEECNLSELLLLLVTEIAEATEGMRAGNPPDDKIPDFSALEAELADIVIRIMHMAEGLDLRVAEALIAKVEFNKTRSYKHGGKKF